jgi:hypothetical protein
MIGKYAYGESSDNGENFFQFQNLLNQSQLDYQKHSTQLKNQDNSSKSTSKQKAEIKKWLNNLKRSSTIYKLRVLSFLFLSDNIIPIRH